MSEPGYSRNYSPTQGRYIIIVGIEGVIGKDVELLGLAEIRKIISSLRFENCSFLLSSTLWYRRGMWQGLSGRSILYVYYVAECLLPYFPSSRKNQVLFEGERMCIVGIKEHTSEFKMSIGYWFLLFSRGLAARQSGFVPDMYLR